MTNYTCEDLSLCKNFQSAICLHCNHRLCVQHIIEHDRIVFGDVNKLTSMVEVTFQQIKDKSEKSRITCNDLLLSYGQWRTQQLEKIEQIYENELQLIIYEGEALEDFHQYLLKQLERDARQPLERVQRQQNANTEILNFIRQTIDKIREECVGLKWEFPTPSLVNSEYSPSDPPPIPVSILIPTIDDIKPIENQQAMHEKRSSIGSSIPSTDNDVKQRKGRPLSRVVKMFSDISSIKQSKSDIYIYIQKQKKYFKLPILVSSYLTAWHKTSKALEKTFILNKHISTIQQYLPDRMNDFDVLVGIQAFFYNNSFREDKSKIMTFLLRFFLDHQCITQDLILNWYNNNDAHGYKGFEEAKQLVEPFIKSFLTLETGETAIKMSNTQTASV